jgi:hypothetical protein
MNPTACNRKCFSIKTTVGGRKGIYSNKEIRYCINCGFLKSIAKFCPCCNVILRTRPKIGLRSNAYKEKIKAKFL